jgi:sulfur-carrier protein adenylyltransferase/sulfurtransferase
MIKSISAAELAEMLRSEKPPRLLDVREQFEYEIASIPGAILLPLGQIPDQVGELERLRDEPIVVYCHLGVRSLHAIRFLQHAGFADLINLSGGIDAWSREVDPEMPRY